MRSSPLIASLIIGALVGSLTSTTCWAEPEHQLRGVSYLGDLPTLVADQRGFFQQAGLNLSVSQERSGKDNLQALRAGDTDFALMALTPLILDALQDETPGGKQDPVILASISHSIGLNFIVARDDAGINNPRDLAGRRIGVMRGTNAELLLFLFLQHHGIDVDQVTMVDQPTDDVARNMESGDLQAGVLWEPWASWLGQRVSGEIRRFPVSNVYTARWVLTTRRSLVDDKPGYCQRLLKAYRRAIRFMDRHPDKARSLYVREFGIDRDQVRTQWDGLIYGLSLNWALLTGINQQASWAREGGHAESHQRIKPLTLIMEEPLRTVMPASVTLPLHDSTRDAPP